MKFQVKIERVPGDCKKPDGDFIKERIYEKLAGIDENIQGPMTINHSDEIDINTFNKKIDHKSKSNNEIIKEISKKLINDENTRETKAYSLIILDKLNKHFYNNKIISPLQFGFKPEFSVSQAIWSYLI